MPVLLLLGTALCSFASCLAVLDVLVGVVGLVGLNGSPSVVQRHILVSDPLLFQPR